MFQNLHFMYLQIHIISLLLLVVHNPNHLPHNCKSTYAYLLVTSPNMHVLVTHPNLHLLDFVTGITVTFKLVTNPNMHFYFSNASKSPPPSHCHGNRGHFLKLILYKSPLFPVTNTNLRLLLVTCNISIFLRRKPTVNLILFVADLREHEGVCVQHYHVACPAQG
jgi:hypothetical protein